MSKYFNILKIISKYRKVYKNYLNVIFSIYKGYAKINVILKDQSKGTLSINDVIWIANLVETLDIDPRKLHIENEVLYYQGKELEKPYPFSLSGWIKENDMLYYPRYNIKFLTTSYILLDTFIMENYNAEVMNREVVDIGANIGDTAIYFAIKGAKHVYAFEPLPSIAEIAKLHVKLNGLEEKIDVINAGVGSQDGKIKVPSKVNIEESTVFSIADNKGDTEVPLISIGKVRGMINDPYLLKMDCEGCEADIILNSELDFEKLFFEHHATLTKVSYKTLERRLREEKYKCYLKSSFLKAKDIGLVYCDKRI